MSFASLQFLIFFFVTLGLISLSALFKNPHMPQLRRITLLVASYVFYGWWDWRFCFLMLALTVIAWAAAKQLDGKWRKPAVYIGVIAPILMLCVFKYLNFFLDSFAAVFGVSDMRSLKIILPVGISFYTFQSLSYTVDVYREKVKAESFLNVALYIAFFPQLVAGPIVKAQDFLPQLKEDKLVTLKGLSAGLQIFVMGMFKKIVLADRLSVFVDEAFAIPNAYSTFTIMLALVGYALQVYFDFSGYSDMAIGCAKCFGYELQRNFNLPYISKTPTEFWERWHISLSTWLQEYLYFPLGGNRKGKVRTYINLMLTMVLGGLWHGAKWTYVLWGAVHGVGLCVYKIYAKYKPASFRVPVPIAVTLTNILMCIGIVFFRSDSVATAMIIFRKLFVWSGGITRIYSWLIVALIIKVIYILWCVKMSKLHPVRVGSKRLNAYYFNHDLSSIKGLTLFFLEIMAIIGLAYTGGSPFIYFQF